MFPYCPTGVDVSQQAHAFVKEPHDKPYAPHWGSTPVKIYGTERCQEESAGIGEVVNCVHEELEQFYRRPERVITHGKEKMVMIVSNMNIAIAIIIAATIETSAAPSSMRAAIAISDTTRKIYGIRIGGCRIKLVRIGKRIRICQYEQMHIHC